jgi:hypothetical protein
LRTVLKIIFGTKKNEIIGEWRKLHSEELHSLYSSPNIVKQIKSRRMRWIGHVALMGEDRKVHRGLVESPEGRNHLEDQDVDGREVSEWIFVILAGVV